MQVPKLGGGGFFTAPAQEFKESRRILDATPNSRRLCEGREHLPPQYAFRFYGFPQTGAVPWLAPTRNVLPQKEVPNPKSSTPK